MHQCPCGNSCHCLPYVGKGRRNGRRTQEGLHAVPTRLLSPPLGQPWRDAISGLTPALPIFLSEFLLSLWLWEVATLPSYARQLHSAFGDLLNCFLLVPSGMYLGKQGLGPVPPCRERESSGEPVAPHPSSARLKTSCRVSNGLACVSLLS